MPNYINYTENSKTVILDLDNVAKFKEGDEMKPLVQISFANAPDTYKTIPYLWKDLLKKLYPAGEEDEE